MANKRKTWGPSALRQKKSQVPDSIKLRLKEKADEIIDNVLKPEHIKPPPTDNDFNYLIDICEPAKLKTNIMYIEFFIKMQIFYIKILMSK